MSIDSSFDTPEHFEQESQAGKHRAEPQQPGVRHFIDALGKSESPGQAVDQALDYFKSNGGESLGEMGKLAKANPVVTAVTAIAALWWLTGNRVASTGTSQLDQTGDEWAADVADDPGSAKARVLETAARMGERTGALKHGAGEPAVNPGEAYGVSSLRRQASEGSNLPSGLRNLLGDQPLVAAAVGIALGALFGACMPTSEREKKLFDQAREKLAEKLQPGWQKTGNRTDRPRGSAAGPA